MQRESESTRDEEGGGLLDERRSPHKNYDENDSDEETEEQRIMNSH